MSMTRPRAAVQRRKVRDEADARRCLAAVVDSGRTLKEWANEHGVDGRSLHMWQLNLDREEGGVAAIRLVELVAPARSTARYALRVGDVTIEVDDDFQEATLRRLLVVLSC